VLAGGPAASGSGSAKVVALSRSIEVGINAIRLRSSTVGSQGQEAA